ncbi:LamG-like jellyroll fold domain-containing protein, partial [Thermoproteota archaeon]
YNGTWHFITVVVDRDSAANTKYYVDGVDVTAATPSVSTLPLEDENARVSIGALSHGQTSLVDAFFNGTIDELRVWNRTLSLQQIQALYNNRTDLIVNQETNSDENWSACITPNDGFEDGTTVCSANTTIAPPQEGILPNATGFNGSTTDFGAEDDLFNVSNLILEKTSYCMIEWLNDNLNVSGANFSDYVLCNPGWTSVDASNLHASLNSSANITLYGLTFVEMPVVYANNIICTTDCNRLLYIGGNLTFNVSHFTNYSAGSNAELTIWDQNDPGMPYAGIDSETGLSIYFYANYTNATSQAPITDADCNISFNDSTTGDFTYSASKALFQYTRIFSTAGTYSYNITCNRSNYEPLNLTDDIIITEFVNILPVVNSIVLNASSPYDSVVDNLTLYTNITDADLDDTTDIINWYLDGTSLMVLNMPFENRLYENTNVSEALAAYYFDSGADDELGNYNGSVYEAVYTSNGKVGGCYQFDGNNDMITIGSLGTMPQQGAITFWMNADVMEDWRNALTTHYAGSYAGIRFEENVDGDFTAFIGDDGGTYDSYTYMTDMEIGEWYHISIVWDTITNRTLGYLDGRVVFNSSHTLWPTSIPDFRVGTGYSTSGSRRWEGRIDEVLVWNKSLSSYDVFEIYKENQNTSEEVIDYSPFDNSGILYGPTFNATAGYDDFGAYKYSGDTYVSIPHDSSLNISDEITVEAWVDIYSTTPQSDIRPTAVDEACGNGGTILSTMLENEGTWQPNWVLCSCVYTGATPMTIDFPVSNPEGITDATIEVETDRSGGNSASDITCGGPSNTDYFLECGSGDCDNWNPPDLGTSTLGVPDECFEDDTLTIKWNRVGSNCLKIDYMWLSYGTETTIVDKNGAYGISSGTTTASGTINGNTISASASSGWKHVVMTYNGSEQRLYVDGELGNSQVLGTSIDTNSDDLLIGPARGIIDNVKIYNISLTPDQIRALYQNRTDIIVANETSVGDVWKACATPNDGFDDGDMNCSNEFEVIDAAPVVTSVILNTTNPATNDTNQNLTGHVTAYDKEGDNITYAYNWYKDDVLNATSLITDGLVAYYPLNNDTLDYWGDNDGTSYGATLNEDGGRIGGGYNFDGTAYINASNASSLDITGELTLGAWVYWKGSDSWNGIVNKWNGASDSAYGLIISDTDQVRFGVYNSTGDYAYVNDTDAFPLNTWTYVVGVYDGSYLRLYVDGIEKLSISHTSGIRSVETSLFIGSQTEFNKFNGSIDEVMIFNRSLNATEINMLYQGSAYGGHTMDSSQTTAGENWTLGVEVADSDRWRSEFNSSDMYVEGYINTPPVVDNIVLSGSTTYNSTVDDLTVTYTTSDIDFHDVKNITDWRMNGTSIAVLNMPFEGGSTGVFTRDYSMFGNNGTVVNAEYNATGGYDSKGAYEFDGDGDYIDIGDLFT